MSYHNYTIKGSPGYTLSTSSIASGSVPMWNGTSATTSWTVPSTNIHNGAGDTLISVPAGGKDIVVDKAATLDVKGTVRINGIDLEERLNTIEKVLQIPTRDATMEAKYPSLKKKYDEYINLLGKYRTFEAIKGDDNGTT